ncbi:hypothetical protein CBM2587_A160446 [Cupriavidus taiwanensis]|uniref:Uncharacterized protein n=1 Tax=Cupriavidus taiwanensis TaxID=164546 RepID=A0A375BJT4_9BURK|nr:hypothetical protein CBM2587_A160446 [Cupriavidus taiwanensis]
MPATSRRRSRDRENKNGAMRRRSACNWRRRSESNRRTRLCRPLHNHSATPPGDVLLDCIRIQLKLPQRRDAANRRAAIQPKQKGKPCFPLGIGAGDESRTRDLNLGKVALYQLSYSRIQLCTASPASR